MRQKRLAALLLALCFMLTFTSASAFAAAPEDQPFKPVQVFDVKAGKVVLTTPNDKEYQEFANKWISSITGLAPQLTNDDSCNYVYRVPLEKPVTISVNGTKLLADDVFLFYCDGKPPLLLVFDEQRRPYLLLFKEDIKPFIKKIGIPAE
ncbi:hypothetical protein [Paenibacillus sp. JDR-2]|uniref:hypothetical protein n=1 Tax=Paenibacillus sp. (strain JDR-2) TaxID=324057 RepID=UPI000166A8AA|nr:hypothetical protein [Paenibacillus sp. JDR-2]ACT01125.1 hypothetical protein Pjdr2_2470 [Paenibacillus sp. JDR-2]